MAGYIAITTSDWIDSIKANGISCAVFWCKKKNFIALSPGEKFYFLEKGQFSSSADRYIVGDGEFCGFEKVDSSQAWDKYSNALGFDTEQDFRNQLKIIYHCDGSFDLGCIVLNQVRFYKKKISLAECDIEFSPYIVSGKKLDTKDCNKVESKSKE